MEREVAAFIIWSYILFILSCTVVAVYFVEIKHSEKRQIFALKLLLHCPGNVIVANHNISSILRGDFSDFSADATTRGSDFYESVIQNMPDSIIFTSMSGEIVGVNKATEQLYGFKCDDIIGKHVSLLGKVYNEENPFDPLTRCEKEMSLVKGDNTFHVELNINSFADNCVITTRDITSVIMYNQLIAEERAKSDHLLSSILPATLVKRVQAGEKNISFAVQSVSILFMDIVSFTPWCGSLPASKVMTTLNLLFKAFDLDLARHSTMTKIKCIGDCYMAVGGIFAEINKPAFHAKETVDYGLDALESIERVNTEIGENLKMGVGVNTGGPIVAGVLETAKPTFEIIGPAINMAQQMENHGVPMFIHISGYMEVITKLKREARLKSKMERHSYISWNQEARRNNQVLFYVIESDILLFLDLSLNNY